MSAYRSAAGRRELEHLYDDAVDRLGVDVAERRVDTRHGSTHVLLAGAADAPPVVLFHGGNVTNPLTLAWYAGLADDYRLVAPDTPGHPGKSAPTRLDPRGDGYGEWVADLLDAFGVDAAPVVGTSYGAGVALRTAAVAPERVARAALVVPAGFGTGPLLPLVGVGLPAVCYRLTAHDWFLDRTLAALATDPDPLVRATVGASLRHARPDRTVPGADAADLRGFDAPVALFVATDDPFFPADAVVPRARARLRTLDRVELLDGERHLLSPAAQRRVVASLRTFLPDTDAETEG
ncbi:alpha/beta fold hydrolase [Candidatus Halobonum tyrrellensis]|uniref:Alpha/beta hydrolase n=1 Tax=Candidatus Halobonum tyrrellensis G22 TaxID=1324957 RepID=V4HDV9_9EURY|nr:alpha/beta hydrolase [Candidatus Halobonum tyrrellensis]ESP88840.1 alpha/beta hydrolase [Candidatus Halobonum tyrrellensis G22]